MIILYTQDDVPFAIGATFEDALQAAVVKQSAITRQPIITYEHQSEVTIEWRTGSITLTAKEVEHDRQ